MKQMATNAHTLLATISDQISKETSVDSESVAKVLRYLRFEGLIDKTAALQEVLNTPAAAAFLDPKTQDVKKIAEQFNPARLTADKLRLSIRGNDEVARQGPVTA